MKSKILLLEDDLNLSETVCDYFEEQGFQVICVYDGEDALSAIYENSFDLLLLDVNVPNKNGFEVLKEVRNQNNNVPAIFTTSLNSMDSLEEGFLSGCDDYIRKPFALKELLLRVQTILKREFSNKNEIINITDDITFNSISNELKQNKIKFKRVKTSKVFFTTSK
jgi:two-component system, OmpR family, response regulator